MLRSSVNGRVGAVLVAAGASQRMGFDKLWARLGEREVVSHALHVLARCQLIDDVALVVSEERLVDGLRLARETTGHILVTTGGAERRHSVEAGARLLSSCHWIIVHDAARPFLDADLIAAGLEAAAGTGAAIAAIPARDTIKRVRHGLVVETLPRDDLWTVQTPQVFRREVLVAALEHSADNVTDEAALVEKMGGRVSVFPGKETNWKITTPPDLELARAWLRQLQGGLDPVLRGQQGSHD